MTLAVRVVRIADEKIESTEEGLDQGVTHQPIHITNRQHQKDQTTIVDLLCFKITRRLAMVLSKTAQIPIQAGVQTTWVLICPFTALD